MKTPKHNTKARKHKLDIHLTPLHGAAMLDALIAAAALANEIRLAH